MEDDLFTPLPSDNAKLRQACNEQDRAWKLGFAAGRTQRRSMMLGGAVAALWLVVRNSRKHVIIRTLAFYGFLGLLVLGIAWVPVLVVGRGSWLLFRAWQTSPSQVRRRVRARAATLTG